MLDDGLASAGFAGYRSWKTNLRFVVFDSKRTNTHVVGGYKRHMNIKGYGVKPFRKQCGHNT